MPTRSDLLPAPSTFPALPERLASERLRPGPPPAAFPPGEAEAERRLAAFAHGAQAGVHAYAESRDRLDLAATSALSPYLRFGMVSARMAAAAARDAGADPQAKRASRGADVWLSELVWREFYHAVLWHFPGVLRRAFDRRLERMPWRTAPAGQGPFQPIDVVIRLLLMQVPCRHRLIF